MLYENDAGRRAYEYLSAILNIFESLVASLYFDKYLPT